MRPPCARFDPHHESPKPRASAGSVTGFVPGLAVADGDIEGDVQLVGRAHLAADYVLDLLAFAGCDLEHELVVDLQEQPRAEPDVPQCTLHTEHRDLDDVGGAALDR